MIRQVWERKPILGDAVDFTRKFESVAGTIAKWCSETNGRIPKKIKVLGQDIVALSKDNLVPSSKARIRVLERERDWLYALKEYYWKQQARVDWLSKGYRNTKFFMPKLRLRDRKISS